MNCNNNYRRIFILPIIVLLLLFSGYSIGLGNAAPVMSEVVLIGHDKIPCSISRIEKDDESETINEWIEKNYISDQASEKYYLPDTLVEIIIDNYYGVAFKTWEHLNFVQNLIVEKDGSFILYSTPDGDFNPNGSVVFQKILGITLPEIPTTSLQSEDFFEIEKENSLEEASCSNRCSSNVKIGEANSIKAYSNGEYSGGGGYCGINSVNGYTTGYKWQCVEYVVRYFYQKFGKKLAGTGNANVYYSKASSKGLNKAPNGGTDKPQVGNIICSAGGGSGHVAIIKEVGSNYVKAVHQNWSCSNGEIKLSMSVKSKSGKKYYTVSGFSSGYPIQGWLWPK